MGKDNFKEDFKQFIYARLEERESAEEAEAADVANKIWCELKSLLEGNERGIELLLDLDSARGHVLGIATIDSYKQGFSDALKLADMMGSLARQGEVL